MQHSKTGNFSTFVISNNHSLIFQVLKGVDSLGERVDFFSFLGFDVQSNSDLETTIIQLHPNRASKPYLNEKNLIHGGETKTI